MTSLVLAMALTTPNAGVVVRAPGVRVAVGRGVNNFGLRGFNAGFGFRNPVFFNRGAFFNRGYYNNFAFRGIGYGYGYGVASYYAPPVLQTYAVPVPTYVPYAVPVPVPTYAPPAAPALPPAAPVDPCAGVGASYGLSSYAADPVPSYATVQLLAAPYVTYSQRVAFFNTLYGRSVGLRVHNRFFTRTGFTPFGRTFVAQRGFAGGFGRGRLR